jgi:hypothetical protein
MSEDAANVINWGKVLPILINGVKLTAPEKQLYRF